LRAAEESRAYSPERRRYRRYPAQELGCKTAWLNESAREEDIELVNISAGGMCLETGRRLREGQQQSFRVWMQPPLGAAVVRSVVRWIRPVNGKFRVGVEFLESDKGWLGPEQEETRTSGLER